MSWGQFSGLRSPSYRRVIATAFPIQGCVIVEVSDVLKFPSNLKMQIYFIASEKKSSTARLKPRSPGNENFTKRVLYHCTSRPQHLFSIYFGTKKIYHTEAGKKTEDMTCISLKEISDLMEMEV